MFVFGYKHKLLEKEYKILIDENAKLSRKEQVLSLEVKMIRMEVESLLGKVNAKKIFESVDDSMRTARRVYGIDEVTKRG